MTYVRDKEPINLQKLEQGSRTNVFYIFFKLDVKNWDCFT